MDITISADELVDRLVSQDLIRKERVEKVITEYEKEVSISAATPLHNLFCSCGLDHEVCDQSPIWLDKSKELISCVEDKEELDDLLTTLVNVKECICELIAEYPVLKTLMERLIRLAPVKESDGKCKICE